MPLRFLHCHYFHLHSALIISSLSNDLSFRLASQCAILFYPPLSSQKRPYWNNKWTCTALTVHLYSTTVTLLFSDCNEASIMQIILCGLNYFCDATIKRTHATILIHLVDQYTFRLAYSLFTGLKDQL